MASKRPEPLKLTLDRIETPVGTVKGRMRLGLKKLRDRLGEGAVMR